VCLSSIRSVSRKRLVTVAIVIGAVGAVGAVAQITVAFAADDYQMDLLERHYFEARKEMVAVIQADVERTSEQLGRSVLNRHTLFALKKTPRHEFVPDYLRNFAYENRALPIGKEQTISQPFIVAIMTDLLDLQPGCKVLDIGTGSGYQAAILGNICDRVFSIEIIVELGLEAQDRLERLGYENITVRIGDGFNGWTEEGPFDAIVVAAVARELPQPLLAQIKPGGRMMIPIGGAMSGQKLVLVEKGVDGTITTRDILSVLFVPLIRDEQQPAP
jgi:protein-L-isoaspartate(D-aspartate) O-methyltransferase